MNWMYTPGLSQRYGSWTWLQAQQEAGALASPTGEPSLFLFFGANRVLECFERTVGGVFWEPAHPTLQPKHAILVWIVVYPAALAAQHSPRDWKEVLFRHRFLETVSPSARWLVSADSSVHSHVGGVVMKFARVLMLFTVTVVLALSLSVVAQASGEKDVVPVTAQVVKEAAGTDISAEPIARSDDDPWAP